MAAALVAINAVSGVGLYAQAQLPTSGSIAATLWTLLFYFTILANVVVALTFAGLTRGVPASTAPRGLTGITLSMILVGIVYALPLQDLPHLTAGSEIANWMLHRISPVLVTAYWIAFVPKGRLRRTDPLLWTLFPLAYVVYALVRGSIEGRYPYPFLDVGQLGWPAVLLNMLLIAIGFVVGGYLIVALDRFLARR